MINILYNYLLKNFLKTFFLLICIFYGFGVILNLFEEIEFFKNINVSIFKPLILTSILIPSILIKLLPFIVFISSMWFMLKIRNNKDLLTLKVFGLSNLKIFFILAFSSFILGWIILFLVNPLTSSLSKYYEKTKSNYARDIDHLVTFNRNGLWIKETLEDGSRIISASKTEKNTLLDVSIYHLDNRSNLIEKIVSKKANIENNEWTLNDTSIFTIVNGVFEKKEIGLLKINSIYTYEKITSLYKNFDTMSFLDLLFNYDSLLNKGYNETFLKQSLHTLLSLPFFLFLMTALASILTMNTLKKSNNFRFIIVGLILTVLIYYFKDLSIALGQTDRLPLVLSIWSPIIALSFFIFIGVLQINEK
jgi:lipopolysaccharide export system permease protein